MYLVAHKVFALKKTRQLARYQYVCRLASYLHCTYILEFYHNHEGTNVLIEVISHLSCINIKFYS